MQGGPGGGAGPWASKDHAILAGAGFSCVKKGARVTPCPFCIQEGVGCRDPVVPDIMSLFLSLQTPPQGALGWSIEPRPHTSPGDLRTYSWGPGTRAAALVSG